MTDQVNDQVSDQQVAQDNVHSATQTDGEGPAQGTELPSQGTAAWRESPMSDGPVLVVSPLAAARACADEIARGLQCPVDIAESRRSAMAALRRTDFAAVVVDDGIAEGDAEAAEQLWNAAGLAVPVQVNFAICSSARVTRELRAALYRRSLEELRARKAAENNLQADIGSALTGIVLELDLLRAADDIPPQFRERLGQVSELTADLRKKLVPPLPARTAVQAALGAVKLGLRASAARSSSMD
jgi:CheY-like chemotaxis protein